MENIVLAAQQILQNTPVRWTELMTNYPVEYLHRQPAPGEWSAVECLYHMIDTESSFGGQLKAMLTGQDLPPFKPVPREGATDTPAALVALAARFAGLRRAHLEILAGASDADLTRQARHAKLGTVTFQEMLNKTITHDLCHLMQAEKALIQPFLAASGPWKVYFPDLVVG